jgi:MauM/NapG family ferredoxin protein
MMRFHRITQTGTLAVFLGLLLYAAYPFPIGLSVDLFLRLDPLLALGTIVASREFHAYLLPGLCVLVATMIMGRFFCGHICPMGTTLDLLQAPLRGRAKASRKDNSYEATERHRTVKYLVLLVILGAGLCGVSLVHIGSPLSLVTRFYGLVAYPIGLLAADTALLGAGSWLSWPPLAWLAHLDVPEKGFATNFFVASLFGVITALAYVQPRFWCRHICPAGGLMGLFGRSPIVKRRVSDACTRCGLCVRECPTSAISEDPAKTIHSECIVCLQCKELCPVSAIDFRAGGFLSNEPSTKPDPSRRGMLLAFASGLLTAGVTRTNIHNPRPRSRERAMVNGELIRPPGAVPEPEFLSKCVRCGECMKACPTNTLQPEWFRAGLEGIFSPVMVPRLGGCATNCSTCGKVCPTGAIRELPLEEKQHAKVGTAWIARQNCLVWEQDKKCLVCDEVCPFDAVSFQPVPERVNQVPFVVANKCTGCGWCESKCPVDGFAAIRVNIMGEIRLASGSYVEKAREYGMGFKLRAIHQDRHEPPASLTPGIHETGTAGFKSSPSAVAPRGGEATSDLPPGFTAE